MMNSVLNNDELCIKNDELCIKNDEFCIKNDEFRKGGSRHGHYCKYFESVVVRGNTAVRSFKRFCHLTERDSSC